jgi:hypothetical protein
MRHKDIQGDIEMLKNLATRTAPMTADIMLGRLDSAPVQLSYSQKRMVETMRNWGGVLSPKDLPDGDLRVLKALEKKGVVRSQGAGDQMGFVLTDVTVSTVETADEPEVVNPLQMSTAEFRALLDQIFGYGGQAKFAKLQGVAKGTVGKWCQGKAEVPVYAAVFLRTLVDMREKGVPLPDFVDL